MANQNEAYDFSLFEPSRKEQEQQRPAPSKQPKKKNNLIRISEEQLEKSRRIKYKPTTVITYISLANGDKAEIIQPEEKSWLDTIADAISGLLS